MPSKITRHGIRWINSDCGLYCSECHTANVSWEISSYQPRCCNTKTWTAKCICRLCGCEWELTREETVSEE